MILNFRDITVLLCYGHKGFVFLLGNFVPRKRSPPMRRIQFTEDEVRQLNEGRIHHEHRIVRRRMTALYLKATGRRHKDICDELNISGLCLRNYLDKYMNEGLEGLKRLGYQGKRNLLDENRDIIIAHLESQPPGTLKEARARSRSLQESGGRCPKFEPF